MLVVMVLMLRMFIIDHLKLLTHEILRKMLGIFNDIQLLDDEGMKMITRISISMKRF